MDVIKLVKALPIDLLNVVSNYCPMVFFLLSESEWVKIDWFKLIRFNFGLIYSKDECTNEEIMRVYLECCEKRKSIFMSSDRSCLLRNGVLLSCGINNFGQLGMGDLVDRHKFEKIQLSKKIVEVKCLGNYTIVRLIDGTLMSCGHAMYGALGLGHLRDRNKFCKVGGIKGNVAELICKEGHTILRFEDGTLMSVGYNSYGGLGLGDRGEIRYTFNEIKGLPRGVEKVICSEMHTIIILADGILMSCGLNSAGQLGVGDNRNRDRFSEIKGVGGNIAEVSCGAEFSMIRLADGGLMSCGINVHGQLGVGDNVERNVFSKINDIGGNVVEMICSSHHTIIRLNDGTLMGCGYNFDNQLGLGDCWSRVVFCKIPFIPKNIVEVTCSNSHTFIRLTDGTIMSCGHNGNGELGLGDNFNRSRFWKITGIKNVSEVMAASGQTIIKLMDGEIMTCGKNNYGQLGLGDTIPRNVFQIVDL